MHNLFIFGIGGTGARVIRALNMLLAANGGMMEEKVKKDNGEEIVKTTRVVPIIIDYDVKNGDKTRALDTLTSYSKLHKEIYNGINTSVKHPLNGFFSTQVAEMREIIQDKSGKTTFNLQYNPPASAKKYSDSIGYDSLDGDLQLTQKLLETLYNTSTNQEFAELYIDTTVGFRGNPNIGSVMLNNISQTREFKEFASVCNGNTGDRVVIIGSLFGGTGSSGIPVLVNAIRNSAINGVNSAKISTILVCPYFKIGAPDEKQRQKGVIDDKIFESKTKAALYYYEDALNDKIDAIYYIGDKNKNTLPHHVGEDEQRNPAHIVELISAMAITHFNDLGQANLTQTDPNTGRRLNHWKYGFEVDIDNAQDFNFSMFPQQSRQAVDSLISFALAGKLVKNYILGNNKDCKAANFYKISGIDKDVAAKNDKEKALNEALNDFIKYYEKFVGWMDELESGSHHRLKSFDFEAKELCDILKTHPFRKENKNFFGKVTMDPTLKETDIFSAMSQIYKTVHMPEGKANELVPDDTLSYAFFHTLYTACCKIVKEKLNLKNK